MTSSSLASPYNAETSAEVIAADYQSHIAGKTVLITGASPRGLGAEFAAVIARHEPACIILATRAVEKAQETAQVIHEAAAASSSEKPIRVHCVELDLASRQQVKAAASHIKTLGEKIDVIVNNAGIMAPPYSKTVDGFESQFATNHLGHFLLTNLLLPDMLARGVPLRVVNISSNGFRYGPVRFHDYGFDNGETYDRWFAYAQSKTANMLFSRSLAKKLGNKGLTAVSVHPGIIFTNLSRHLAMEDFEDLGRMDRVQGHAQYWNKGFAPKSPSQGVATHVFAAFSPLLDQPDLNGSHLTDSGVTSIEDINSWARDPIDAERLWKLSEKLTGLRSAY